MNHRSRVFVEPTNKEIIVLFASYVVTFDVKTMRQKDFVRLGHEHPTRIILQGRTLIFSDRGSYAPDAVNRTYNLDQKVEGQTENVWIMSPYRGDLTSYVRKESRSLNKYVELDNDSILTIERERTPEGFVSTINRRTLPDYFLKSSSIIQSAYDHTLKVSPDKKLVLLQSRSLNRAVVYETETLKPLRTIWNQTGDIDFSSDSTWAVNHGQEYAYDSRKSRPLLVNLNNFKVYLLGKPFHEIEDASVVGSLNIAATIDGKTLEVFNLPK